ncbi:MAG: hypothetical protein WEA99_02825 [Brumimicrobium sp.]
MACFAQTWSLESGKWIVGVWGTARGAKKEFAEKTLRALRENMAFLAVKTGKK